MIPFMINPWNKEAVETFLGVKFLEGSYQEGIDSPVVPKILQAMRTRVINDSYQGRPNTLELASSNKAFDDRRQEGPWQRDVSYHPSYDDRVIIFAFDT